MHLDPHAERVLELLRVSERLPDEKLTPVEASNLFLAGRQVLRPEPIVRVALTEPGLIGAVPRDNLRP
jgi:hypothetical protein